MNTDENAVTLIHPVGLTDKAPYAYVAVTPPDRSLVFTAGACPLDAEGETVAPGDLAAQANQMMDNLQTALRSAGAELRDVAKTTLYVVTQRQEDLVTAWHVVRERFGDHDAPSTLLGVAVLGYHDQLVEVEAVAVVPRHE